MDLLSPLRKKIVIEKRQRISQSQFWHWQKAYFNKAGINAWMGEVPFYVTSNPFIAHSYAKVLLGFISDWLDRHPQGLHQPFYLTELGTGSGRFSFYLLKALEELKSTYLSNDLKIIYVLTDVAEKNLKFYRTHPAFQSYFEKGMLDIAYFDCENPSAINLQIAQTTLTADLLQNPLLVVGNYIFDTITNDGFYTDKGQLSELLFTLTTDSKNLKEDHPVDLKKIDIIYGYNSIEPQYYGETTLDSILAFYRQHLKRSHFWLPIAGIRTLEFLKNLADDKVFLITSDKSYTQLGDLEGLDFPKFAKHGSLSVMVNYHALGLAIEKTGGQFYAQRARAGISTCAASLGFRFDDFQKTNAAIKEAFEEFSPSDFFAMHLYFCDIIACCHEGALLSHLALSRWDPYTFLKMSAKMANFAEANPKNPLNNLLAANLPKVAENYYFIPNTECVLFEIGVFYHAMKDYQKALDHYEQAQKYVGQQYGLYYNSALCYFHSGQLEKAKLFFTLALKTDPTAKDPKEWLTYLAKNRI